MATMIRLLKLDIKRAFRDKAFIIITIIVALFAFLQVLIASQTVFVDPFTEDIYRMFTARDIIESSFQISSTPVIIIGALIALFIAKDINQGTIRNKLIAGYSKLQIYIAAMIISITIGTISLLMYQGIIASFIFEITFPIDQGNVNDLANFWINFAFGHLLIIVLSAMITFIAMMVKNTAGTVIIAIVIMIFSPIIGILLNLLTQFLFVYNAEGLTFVQMEERTELINKIFEYFYIHQVSVYAGNFLTGGDPTDYFAEAGRSYALKVSLTNIGRLALLIVGGGFWFRKTDLK
jgi:hypothetical protein